MPSFTLEEAIAAVQRGEVIVVVDDESRENEGDLILAAEKVRGRKRERKEREREREFVCVKRPCAHILS